MKVYIYKGIEYKTAHQVRQAIFESERKAFTKCETSEDWANHGVTVEEKEAVLTEEQLASQARAKRDAMLSKSDYYVMSDYPSSEEGLAEVKKYRQALRDITGQYSFPYMISWPNKPSVLG